MKRGWEVTPYLVTIGDEKCLEGWPFGHHGLEEQSFNKGCADRPLPGNHGMFGGSGDCSVLEEPAPFFQARAEGVG